MNNINIDNLHQSPKSARAVCKVLEQIGIKGMELWKNRYNKHYVFSGTHEDFTLGAEQISYHDLRLSDFTLIEWLGLFYYQAIESDWDKSYCFNADIVNPAFNRLENYLIEWGYLSKAL